MSTPIDLDAIRKRHGAWYDGESSSFPWGPDDPPSDVVVDLMDRSLADLAMAHEIVREDVPALLDYIDHLHQQLAERSAQSGA